MATDYYYTFNFDSTAASIPLVDFGVNNGEPPIEHSASPTGWTVAKTAAGYWSHMMSGVKRAATTFVSGAPNQFTDLGAASDPAAARTSNGHYTEHYIRFGSKSSFDSACNAYKGAAWSYYCCELYLAAAASASGGDQDVAILCGVSIRDVATQGVTYLTLAKSTNGIDTFNDWEFALDQPLATTNLAIGVYQSSRFLFYFPAMFLAAGKDLVFRFVARINGAGGNNSRDCVMSRVAWVRLTNVNWNARYRTLISDRGTTNWYKNSIRVQSRVLRFVTSRSINLSAQCAAQSSFNPAFGTAPGAALASSVSAVSACGGTLSDFVAFSWKSTMVAQPNLLNVNLRVGALLDVMLNSDSSLSPTLRTGALLDVAASISASVVAALSARTQFDAETFAEATLAAGLTSGIKCQAMAVVESQQQGTLETSIRVVGIAEGVAVCSGFLKVGAGMSSGLVSDSEISAALTTSILMAADAAAESSVHARIQVDDPPFVSGVTKMGHVSALVVEGRVSC